jgi:flagellar basal-body rod protein FlgG
VLRGIGIGASQLAVQSERLKSISSNLANADTPGYAQDQVAQQGFDEILLSRLDAGRSRVGGMDLATVPARPTIDLQSGPIEATERPLDVAISGSGFFAVQSPSGVQYTRRGAFHQDAQGQLVSLEGWPVLGQKGPITAAGPMRISPSGDVVANGQAVDRLQVVQFAPSVAFDRQAGTYLVPTAGAPAAVASPHVMSGYLEGSNVDLTSAMTDLVAATRSYQVAQRAIVTQDNALQTLIQAAKGQ